MGFLWTISLYILTTTKNTQNTNNGDCLANSECKICKINSGAVLQKIVNNPITHKIKILGTIHKLIRLTIRF